LVNKRELEFRSSPAKVLPAKGILSGDSAAEYLARDSLSLNGGSNATDVARVISPMPPVGGNRVCGTGV